MSAPEWTARARSLLPDYLRLTYVEDDLARALHAAYARGHADGMEDSAKLCDQVEDESRAVEAQNGAGLCAVRIRWLARLPSGGEGE